MEPSLLAKISIRVVSIYVISQSFMMLPNILTLAMYSENNPYLSWLEIFFTFASIIAPMIFGLTLWFFAQVIAKLMVGAVNLEPVKEKLTATHLHTIAISTAGLVIIVLTLPSLVYKLHQLITDPTIFKFDQRDYEIMSISYILIESLKLFFGLLLMLGSPFWVRLLQRFRTYSFK